MRMPPESRNAIAINGEPLLFERLLQERTETLCGCDPEPAFLRDVDVTPPGVRRIAEPYDGHVLRPGDPVLQRIAASLVLPLDACGCIESTYAKSSQRYTQVCHGGRMVFVHRLLFGYANGPLPLDQTIDHICGNPGCVNVAHLRLVPVSVNILSGRAPAAQNARKDRCPRCGGNFESAYGKQGERGRRLCRRCVRTYARAHRRAARNDVEFCRKMAVRYFLTCQLEPENRGAAKEFRFWHRRFCRLSGTPEPEYGPAARRMAGA